MKAMILAAGRGERMRPLTDDCPKPLLTVANKPLISYHLEKIASLGITDVVVNYAWLGQQIVDYCQQGQRWGVTIHYSEETQGALETAGGIIQALPMLTGKDDEPFLVINADIFCDFPVSQLPSLAKTDVAHLFLVANPEHNPQGDFELAADRLQNKTEQGSEWSYTFSGIGLYRPSFFSTLTTNKKQPLAPLIKEYAQQNKVCASLLPGYWYDIGTPARLAMINQQVGTK